MHGNSPQWANYYYQLFFLFLFQAVQHDSTLDAAVLQRCVLVLPQALPGCKALLCGPPRLFRQPLESPQEHEESHQQTRLHHHKHKQTHLRGQSQVTVPVVAGVQNLLLV